MRRVILVARRISIVVSDVLYQRLREFSEKTGISIQDIMVRAIVKALEDFEKVGRGGRR